MSHPGNDSLNELRFDELMDEMYDEVIDSTMEDTIPDHIVEQLSELTEIPLYLYKECREEGMDQKTAVKETFKRFYE